MPKINTLSFIFFLIFTLFFINSCGKSADNNQANTLLVSSNTPKDRDENVQINENIIFTFNESINESSIGNDNLSVLDASGNVVNGNIRVVGNRVIFDPSSDLAYDTKYIVSLTKSIKSESGATLKNIYSFSFVTKKETKDNEKPSIPTNLTTSNITESGIRISWNASTDNDGNIDNYYVSYKKENGLYYSEIKTTDTYKVFISLESNANYTFRVRAQDNDGDFSDYAYSSSAKTLQATNEKPTPPTNIQSTNITQNSITLSWGSSTDSDGNIGSYLVSYKTSSGDYGSEQSTSSVTKIVDGLTANTDYTFRVRAKDNDGDFSDYAYSDLVKTIDAILITPPPSSSLLKKTGQTTSYADYDDGHYQTGVSPNYTRSNDIVTDTVTNLMWQDDSDAKNSQNNWDGAIAYCASLSLGGHSDWKLPTVEELLYIVDIGKANNAFQNMSSSSYLSSSIYVSNLSRVWFVYLGNGQMVYIRKTKVGYVRCVRSVQ